MKYYTTSLLCFCCLFSIVTYAQNPHTDVVDSLAIQRVQALLDAGVAEEVLLFSDGCIGCEPVDTCQDGYPWSRFYLLWQEQDQLIIERLIPCMGRFRKSVANTELWDHLEQNEAAIFTSTFKEHIITDHYSFWALSFYPSYPKAMMIYRHYFDEDHEFRQENLVQPANVFRGLLLETIKESW